MVTEVQKGSFVFEQPGALSADVCQEMIRRFETDDQQYEGLVGTEKRIDLTIKQSTDLMISIRDDWADIDAELFKSLNVAMNELVSLYESIASIGSFDDDGYQIQRTKEGGFYIPHTDSNEVSMANRFLVALWYLNDNFSGGHTGFTHQNLEVVPEVGKLALFPPWWTHWHEGQPVLKGTKYIATTWLLYKR